MNDNHNNARDFTIGFDIHGDTLPKFFVDKLLETTKRFAEQNAREDEREEIVCRLLASGMPVEEISLLLKIRVEEIQMIGRNNAKIKIPEYTRTFKARAKKTSL